jgi:UDP-N-acetylglucosamine 3-dehydrogenase
MSLKIGVIGIGSMGKNHTRVCAELPNIELVGLADLDKITLQKISQRFDVSAFTNYKELIQKVDAIIIATPTSTHYKIAMDCLNQGKNILLEKPICEDVKKAEELVKKAKKERLVLSIGHIERHNPAVQFAKENLKLNKLGELITLTSKRVSVFTGRISDVGVIYDSGIHDIDVMRYLAGEVTSVYARAGNFNKKITHEDYANIVLNFKNGVCGVIEVNWLTPVKIRKLFLTCSEFFVEVDYIDQSVTMSSSSFNKIDEMNLFNIPIQYNINSISLEKKEPLRNEIIDFIKAVEHKSKPLVTGEDGLQALKIAEAARLSYRTGEEVKIS